MDAIKVEKLTRKYKDKTALAVSTDRYSSFLIRLYASPMKSGDFTNGYNLDIRGLLLVVVGGIPSAVMFITMYLWKLQTIPVAFLCTVAGYGLTFIIMGVIQYKSVKQDIEKINQIIDSE